MTILFSDDFNRADNTNINTTNWTEQSSSDVWDISGNTLRITAISGANPHFVITTTSAHAAVADCKVTATRVSSNTFDGGVFARGSGTFASSTFYYVDLYSGTTIDVIRRVAGADTLLQTLGPLTHADGDIYALQVSGTGSTVTLKFFRNGSQVGSDILDSSGSRITAAGQTGIINWSNNPGKWDDFMVEDVSAGPVITVVPAANPQRNRRTTGRYL